MRVEFDRKVRRAARTDGVDRAGLFTGLVRVSALFAAAAAGQSDLTGGGVLGALAVGGGIVLGVSKRPSREAPST